MRRMPATTYEVTTYRYEFRRSATGSFAVVWLSSGDRLVCSAAFVDGGRPLPPPNESANGVITMSLRASSLHDVIDMLRNEKPVYFLWSPEAKLASITTFAEPVGEGEIAWPPPPKKRTTPRKRR
jgi:hypothetical protein